MSTKLKTCFFCGQPIKGKAEKHHIRPRRLFRKGENHRRNNLAPAHHDCHQTWHRTMDKPRLKRWQWEQEFASINFGRGIYSGD